jgi:hypothetical protein
MDAPGSFGITVLLISGQYQLEIPAVLLFLLLTDRGSFQPGIIAALGNPGCRTEFFGGEGVPVLCQGLLNNLKNTRRVVHEQCTYFLVVLTAEIFFKNSTSCFR